MFVLVAEFGADSAGVDISGVKSVPLVHKEDSTLPSYANNDVLVRELVTIEEICGCDADGVGQPNLEIFVSRTQIQNGAHGFM